MKSVMIHGLVLAGLAFVSAARSDVIETDTVRSLIGGIRTDVTVLGPGIDLHGVTYFPGTTTAQGAELWRSDGTPAGTMIVRDILPGPGGSDPLGFQAGRGRLFFQANDGVHGRELWTSDGSESGTFLVKDIAPGSVSSWPLGFQELNGRVYFRATEPQTGFELWGTDGSQAGTWLVKDIAEGPSASAPASLVVLDGRLHFRAADASHGAELWTSDGTAAGTYLLRDLVPGPAGSAPFYFNVDRQVMFFRTRDTVNGDRQWMTNGTVSGTWALPGYAPGKAELSWQAPSMNTDGSPLLDLAGYRVVYGLAPYALDRSIEISDARATAAAIDDLPPGTYYFALHAINSLDRESPRSHVLSKRIR